MADPRVVLDTDFINEITKYASGDPADLLCRLFRELSLRPVVHRFVAENELMHNQVAQKLIQNGTIEVIDLRRLQMPGLSDDEAEAQYKEQFGDMYKALGFETISPGTDIFARKAGHSYGEIHSILLATEFGIPLMYSNDSDAKWLAEQFISGRLIVYNAEELGERLEGCSCITNSERKFIRNTYRRKRKKSER